MLKTGNHPEGNGHGAYHEERMRMNGAKWAPGDQILLTVNPPSYSYPHRIRHASESMPDSDAL